MFHRLTNMKNFQLMSIEPIASPAFCHSALKIREKSPISPNFLKKPPPVISRPILPVKIVCEAVILTQPSRDRAAAQWHPPTIFFSHFFLRYNPDLVSTVYRTEGREIEWLKSAQCLLPCLVLSLAFVPSLPPLTFISHFFPRPFLIAADQPE